MGSFSYTNRIFFTYKLEVGLIFYKVICSLERWKNIWALVYLRASPTFLRVLVSGSFDFMMKVWLALL